ncbi:MAG: dimethyl sulfoxide reductase anchor subunit [Rhodospirillales bacterium]|nr:dimethyl sulfoxide reductase anchor subunit [Rhodospirillales bacterium]
MKGTGMRADQGGGVNPTLQKDWDIRGTGNFIFGGVGSGLLIVAAIAAFIGMPQQWPIGLGLFFVLLGLLCVLAKIGRPFRALNVIFNPKTSWMSREALAAFPVFAAGGAAILFPWPPLAALAALFGGAFLYCQGMILTASKGIPAWRSTKTLPLIMVTGIVEGAGAFMIVGALSDPQTMATALPVVSTVLLVTIAARVFAWRGYRRSLDGDSAPRATREVLANAEVFITFAGHVVPVLLIFVSMMLPREGHFLAMGAGAFAIAGGWYLKFIIVNRAAFNQGFAILHSPARGGGKSGPGIKPGWS